MVHMVPGNRKTVALQREGGLGERGESGNFLFIPYDSIMLEFS